MVKGWVAFCEALGPERWGVGGRGGVYGVVVGVDVGRCDAWGCLRETVQWACRTPSQRAGSGEGGHGWYLRERTQRVLVSKGGSIQLTVFLYTLDRPCCREPRTPRWLWWCVTSVLAERRPHARRSTHGTSRSCWWRRCTDAYRRACDCAVLGECARANVRVWHTMRSSHSRGAQ